MIGLQSGKVALLPYTKEWAKAYETEEKLLWSALEGIAIDIQHVGSTSIPGLESKPIIDICVGVESLEKGEECIEPLIKLGYEYKHDAGIKGRHFFAKGPKVKRTHYVHVVELGGAQWNNLILFRNYLRKHKEYVIEYGKLKSELAKKYKDDRDTYTECKDGFIKGVLDRAKLELKK